MNLLRICLFVLMFIYLQSAQAQKNKKQLVSEPAITSIESQSVWKIETRYFYEFVPSLMNMDRNVCHLDTMKETSEGIQLLKVDPRKSGEFLTGDYLIDKLLDLIKSGSLTAYDVKGDNLLTWSELEKKCIVQDTFVMIDPITINEIWTVSEKNLLQHIYGFYVNQEWQIDNYGQLNSRILSIQLVASISDDEVRSPSTRKPLFMIKFNNDYASEFSFSNDNIIWMSLTSSQLPLGKERISFLTHKDAFLKLFPGKTECRFSNKEFVLYNPFSAKQLFPDSLCKDDPYHIVMDDSLLAEDPETGEIKKLVDHIDKIIPEEEREDNVIQCWYFDEKTKQLNSQVIACAPMVPFIRNGVIVFYKSPYFIRYIK